MLGEDGLHLFSHVLTIYIELVAMGLNGPFFITGDSFCSVLLKGFFS
jgi:hypothetical protein